MGFKAGLTVALTALGVGIGVLAPGSALGAAACSGADKPTADLSKGKARDAVACLFNAERSARNVRTNRHLEKVAQSHTETMRQTNCFLHQCPGELSLDRRVKRTGYSSSPYVGEVLIQYPSQATPQDVVKAWMNSSPHRAVITNGRFRDVGVGLSVRGANVIYTAVLGHK